MTTTQGSVELPIRPGHYRTQFSKDDEGRTVITLLHETPAIESTAKEMAQERCKEKGEQCIVVEIRPKAQTESTVTMKMLT